MLSILSWKSSLTKPIAKWRNKLWCLCLDWDLTSKKLMIGPILMYYFPDHLVPERKCAASRFLLAFCRTVVDAINIITAANNDIIQFVSKFILFVTIYKIVKKLYDSLFNMLCAYTYIIHFKKYLILLHHHNLSFHTHSMHY